MGTWLRRPIAAAALGGALLAAVAGCSIAPSPAPTPVRTEKTVVDPTTPSTGPSATPSASISSAPISTAPSSSATPSDAASAPASRATPSKNPLHTVHPFITRADWDAGAATLEVEAVVPGVVEQGGTCTAVATSGGASRTVSGQATATAQSTGCEPLRLAGPDLTAGTWSVVVRYASARSSGVSAARTVEVVR